jgi:hypothetical protein
LHEKIRDYYKDIYIYRDTISDEIGYYKVSFWDISTLNITEVKVASQLPDGSMEYYFNGKSYSEDDMLKILKLDIYC